MSDSMLTKAERILLAAIDRCSDAFSWEKVAARSEKAGQAIDLGCVFHAPPWTPPSPETDEEFFERMKSFKLPAIMNARKGAMRLSDAKRLDQVIAARKIELAADPARAKREGYCAPKRSSP